MNPLPSISTLAAYFEPAWKMTQSLYLDFPDCVIRLASNSPRLIQLLSAYFAEQEIIRIIGRAYPDHGFLAEESGEHAGNELQKGEIAAKRRLVIGISDGPFFLLRVARGVAIEDRPLQMQVRAADARHQAERLAVPLRVGHAEVAPQVAARVAPLLMADEHDGPAVEAGQDPSSA